MVQRRGCAARGRDCALLLTCFDEKSVVFSSAHVAAAGMGVFRALAMAGMVLARGGERALQQACPPPEPPRQRRYQAAAGMPAVRTVASEVGQRGKAARLAGCVTGGYGCG